MTMVFVPVMKRNTQMVVCSLMGAALSFGGCTSGSNSPRVGNHGIADRDQLSLKAPAVSAVPLPPATPRPKVSLSGITTIMGKKMAFLAVFGSEPGETPKYLSLGEGQREQEIEVREIDAKRGIVKVINGGQEQILEFNATKT